MGVWLRVEDQQGVIGSERETIAEDLLQTKPIQDEVLKILRDSYRGNHSNVNKWKKAHNRIRDYLMRETKKRRKKVQPEIKILESKLKVLGYKKKAGGGSRELDTTERKIVTKIRELKYPERLKQKLQRHERTRCRRGRTSAHALSSSPTRIKRNNSG